jgi:hypothetical protein
VTDTAKARRPAKQPDGASPAPHAPAPQTTAPAAEPAAPAWAAASVAAPFSLGLPVQRKPVIGRADDAYEREADAVADRVAARSTVAAPLNISRVTAAALAPPVQRKSPGDRTDHDDEKRPDGGGPGVVQRQAEPGDDEKRDDAPAPVLTKPVDGVVQRAEDEDKPDEAPAPVQTKPVDGVVQRASEDEKREDGAAPVQTKALDGVVQRASEDEKKPDDEPAPVQTKPADGALGQGVDDEKKPDDAPSTVQTKPIDGVVQRAPEDEKKSEGEPGPVQAKGAPGGLAGGSPAMRDAAGTAIATRGPGSPLPRATRGTLESGIGVDLRDVRVHTGPAAEQATQQLRARAFTHGKDIWLGRGESPSDTRLMAHEATHVVQQDGVVRRAPVAPAAEVADQEAEDERRRREEEEEQEEQEERGSPRATARAAQREVSTGPGAPRREEPRRLGEPEAASAGAAPTASPATGPAAPVAPSSDETPGTPRAPAQAERRVAAAPASTARDTGIGDVPAPGSPTRDVATPAADAADSTALTVPRSATPTPRRGILDRLRGMLSPRLRGRTAAPGATEARPGAGPVPSTTSAGPAPAPRAASPAPSGDAAAPVASTVSGAPLAAAATMPATAPGATAGTRPATDPATAAPTQGAAAVTTPGTAPTSAAATPGPAAATTPTTPTPAPGAARTGPPPGVRALPIPFTLGGRRPGIPVGATPAPGQAPAAGPAGALAGAAGPGMGPADALAAALPGAAAPDVAGAVAGAPGAPGAGAVVPGAEGAPAAGEAAPASPADKTSDAPETAAQAAAGAADAQRTAGAAGPGGATALEGGPAGPATATAAGPAAGPAPAGAEGGGAAPDTAAPGGPEGQDEAASGDETAARMAAAQPESDRAAEASADEEAAESGGEAPAAPSLGGAADSAGEAEAAPAEADTEAPEAAADTPVEAAPAPAADTEPGAAAPAEAAAPEADAGAEPAPAPVSEELPPAERDAGLGSIGESGGGAEYAGGGGGGGGAVPEPPEPTVPSVPQNDPESALAAVSSLPPAQMAGALGQVSAAATGSVGQQRQALAAAPPELQRPSGAPATRGAPGAADAAPPPAEGAPRQVARAPEGTPVQTPAPEPLPAPPPSPTQRVATPEEPADVAASLRRLPTTDPGLEVDAGAPPRVALEGNADPARAREQRAELQAGMVQARADGQRDLAQPMGEDEIYPTVPPETLRAQVPAGGAAGEGGAAGAAGGADDPAVAIIAQQERGDQVRDAALQARTAMATQRQDHAARATEERAASSREVARLEQESAAEQTAERATARREVQAQREQWSTEQQTLSESARTEADGVAGRGEADIQAQRTSADSQARGHLESGAAEAATVRRDAQAQAAGEQRRGEQEAESGGVFGWLRSRARAFFDGVKRRIQEGFERARSAVRGLIDRAKRAAMAVIETARQAIVSVIRGVGALLIAIGDRVLAGFPALRDRFRRAIRERVAAAEAAVNRMAERLKRRAQAALDALGAALNRALAALERGFLAAVDAVNRAVNAALDFARNAVAGLAAFAALIRDIAAGPGQWISNLGAAIVDGIRNHLWRAFKEAVKGWFNSKLEEVLGLGTAIWGVLRRGGISLAQVGRMAFQALKAAIPAALVTILLEKLVAMIVPAAAAVMAIVEGLQAAWGTVSRVITAFGLFFAFLRAVKTGSAGPQFASALAAAAVVVIDFTANWLLRRLIRPARGVGGRIRAIAQRIMARLRRVMQRVGRAVRRGMRRVRRGISRLRARFGRRRGGRQNAAQRRHARERHNRERLDHAVSVLRPQINSLLSRRVWKLRLRAQLALWRASYRIRRLVLKGGGGTLAVEAGNSLGIDVVTGVMEGESQRVYRMVREIATDLMRQPGTREMARQIQAQRQASFPGGARGTTAATPVVLPPSIPAQSLDILQNRPPGFRSHYTIGGGMHSSAFTEFRGRGTTAGSIRVQSPSIGGGSYSDILTRVPTLAPSGGAPSGLSPAVAVALTTFQQRGILPPGVPFGAQAAPMAGALTRLAAVEGARDPGYLVIRAATMHGMREGLITPQQALIDLNPMERATLPGQRPGAPRTAAEIARRQIPGADFRYGTPLSGAMATALPGEMERFLRVERDAIVRAVLMRLQTTKPLFNTESDLRTYIRRELQDELARIVRNEYPT